MYAIFEDGSRQYRVSAGDLVRVDYRETPVGARVEFPRVLLCANGADVIYDGVGGDYTEAALRAIAWAGRHLVVGFTAGIPKLPLNLPLLKSCQVIGVFWGDFANRYPDKHAANVAALMQLYVDGKIKPAVTERYPLARGADAIARLGARQARGKIVVTV